MTKHGDAHGYLVCDRINKRGFKAHVFDIDQVALERPLSIEIARPSAAFSDHFGINVDIEQFSTCWWRRFPSRPSKEKANALAEVRAQAAFQSFVGGFLTVFKGRNISCPYSSLRAENKLLQLYSAGDLGLRVPNTLISNDTERISEFFSKFAPECLVKTLVQPVGSMIDAKKVRLDDLDLADIAQVPTIFQEYIAGTVHLRILLMGEELVCFEFESHDVDWRRFVPRNFRQTELDTPTRERLFALQELLGLTMSVVDMKRDQSGDSVFLELNPQGQFLFMEPLSNVPLTDIFSDFLISSARG